MWSHLTLCFDIIVNEDFFWSCRTITNKASSDRMGAPDALVCVSICTVSLLTITYQYGAN